MAQIQEELVDAFKWNDEARLRALVAQLAAHSRHARALLDEMLESPDGRTRQAAVFALGQLGGDASLKRLERQMDIEEARNDYDGESVLQVITEALGRAKQTRARASLIRRLKRLVAGRSQPSDVDDVAYALWRKRHPELIPVVRDALEQFPPDYSWALSALLHLLETPPAPLITWILDSSAPLKKKTDALCILDEEVPDEYLPVISAFISEAHALGDAPVKQRGEASNFCDRLFTTILLHAKRVVPALPAEVRADLRALARKCMASVDTNCQRRAVWMLRHVGVPDDAALIEAHRPQDPGFAKTFDEVAQILRSLPTA